MIVFSQNQSFLWNNDFEGQWYCQGQFDIISIRFMIFDRFWSKSRIFCWTEFFNFSPAIDFLICWTGFFEISVQQSDFWFCWTGFLILLDWIFHSFRNRAKNSVQQDRFLNPDFWSRFLRFWNLDFENVSRSENLGFSWKISSLDENLKNRKFQKIGFLKAWKN